MNSPLMQVGLPVAIIVIMFGMGLSLRWEDFGRIVRFPQAFWIGVSAQMLLLPVLAVAIIWAFQMEPYLAMGLLICSLCPGGAVSNLISYWARADLALSVSMTAVVSVVTPFTIPLLAKLGMIWQLGAARDVDLPLLKTIAGLFAVTILPIVIGMSLRSRFPRFAERAESGIKVFSLGFLLTIIAALLFTYADRIGLYLARAGGPTMLLNALGIIVGVFLAQRFALSPKQGLSIGIEVGIQNCTLALLVTGTMIGNEAMTVAPAVYGIMMWPIVMLYILWNKRRNAQEALEEMGGTGAVLSGSPSEPS